jgi:two-component system, chemotaxis family, sensor kinase CheA
VGMDAARTAVEALGGRILVSSTRGKGTSVQLSLPQAVVITAIMIVAVGDERFGIPIEAVVETARIPVARIQAIRNGAAFVLRDRTIPLLGLAALLNLPSPPRVAAEAKVLIAWAGDQLVGIEVDSFAERTDTLLRPITGLLAGMPGILGSALLGDGSLLMILNLTELVG